MTNREVAQKLYYMIDQWLPDAHKSQWIAKRTGRAQTTWHTFFQTNLFKRAAAFPSSDMIEEFIKWGWVLYQQLWAANFKRTRFDIRSVE